MSHKIIPPISMRIYFFVFGVLSVLLFSSFGFAEHSTADKLRISLRITWLQKCSPGSIKEFLKEPGIYQIDLSMTKSPQEVLDCLFKAQYEKWNDNLYSDFVGEVVNNSGNFVMYSSILNINEGYDGGPFGTGEGVGLIEGNLIFILPMYSEGGLSEASFCKGDFGSDIFYSVSGFTTRSTYFLNLKTGKSVYLGNGVIDSKCRKGSEFVVRDKKGYFVPNGAFFYDALFSRDGELLDIVTPRDENYVHCLPWSKFRTKAGWDIEFLPKWGWFKRLFDFSVCYRI
jgi:hypothetical protein